MRMKANTIPVPFEIKEAINKKVRVLLRENIRYLSETELEYDEYSIQIPSFPNLEEDLNKNIRMWIAYGKKMETPDNSSALWHLNEKHDEELTISVNTVRVEGEKQRKADEIKRCNELFIAYEDDFTATRNYSEKSFISIQDKLYEVIYPIPRWSSIIIGQNVIETTIEHYLEIYKEESNHEKSNL